ncbi:phosphatidylinositol 4-kinase alpha 1-like protein isoform X1 [Tanacetum coccineum]
MPEPIRWASNDPLLSHGQSHNARLITLWLHGLDTSTRHGLLSLEESRIQRFELSNKDAKFNYLRYSGIQFAKYVMSQVFSLDKIVEHIDDRYCMLRVEGVPEEEKDLCLQDCLVRVNHSNNDSPCLNQPFLLAVHEGETLAEVKVRIQKKSEVSDEEFSKWKFSHESWGRRKPLQDSDIVSSYFQVLEANPSSKKKEMGSSSNVNQMGKRKRVIITPLEEHTISSTIIKVKEENVDYLLVQYLHDHNLSSSGNQTMRHCAVRSRDDVSDKVLKANPSSKKKEMGSSSNCMSIVPKHTASSLRVTSTCVMNREVNKVQLKSPIMTHDNVNITTNKGKSICENPSLETQRKWKLQIKTLRIELLPKGANEKKVVRIVQLNVIRLLAEINVQVNKPEVVDTILPLFIENLEEGDASTPVTILEAASRMASLRFEKSYREVIVLMMRSYLSKLSSIGSVKSNALPEEANRSLKV